MCATRAVYWSRRRAVLRDGHADANSSCDHANRTCGACSADCSVSRLQASSGLIFAAKASDYDWLQATPGTRSRSPRIRHQDVRARDRHGHGHQHLDSDRHDDTNADVAQKIATKIAANLNITATVLGGVVTLTDQIPSVRGDVDITNGVQTTNFAVVGMHNSLGGDCLGGAACTDDVDCASNSCSIVTGSVGTCDP